jgi:hypothetical protein
VARSIPARSYQEHLSGFGICGHGTGHLLVGVHGERRYFHSTQDDRRGLNEARACEPYRTADGTAGWSNAIDDRSDMEYLPAGERSRGRGYSDEASFSGRNRGGEIDKYRTPP